MMNTPSDDLQAENTPDEPEKQARLSFSVSGDELSVPPMFASKNSPPTCRIVQGDVSVRIASATAGGTVDAKVQMADTRTRMCHATYDAHGRKMMKWVSFDETDPPLEAVVPEQPERPTTEDSVVAIAAYTRKQAEPMARVLVYVRPLLCPYTHEAYPHITEVLHLTQPIGVMVYSKTQQCQVHAAVDMVSADLHRCRVSYLNGPDHQFKWTSVDAVAPPLMVIQEGEKEAEKNPA